MGSTESVLTLRNRSYGDFRVSQSVRQIDQLLNRDHRFTLPGMARVVVSHLFTNYRPYLR